jgi:hypothetical protein
VALERTDASDDRIASIIRAERISELEIALAVTSNRSWMIYIDNNVDIKEVTWEAVKLSS